jgi:hypothetical protein
MLTCFAKAVPDVKIAIAAKTDSTILIVKPPDTLFCFATYNTQFIPDKACHTQKVPCVREEECQRIGVAYEKIVIKH